MYHSVSQTFLLFFLPPECGQSKRMAILTVEIFNEDHEFYRHFRAFNLTVIKQIWVNLCFDRLCTYNVTLMHVRVTIVAMEKQ